MMDAATAATEDRDQQSHEPGAAGKALAIIEHGRKQGKSREEIATELASIGLASVGESLGYGLQAAGQPSEEQLETLFHKHNGPSWAFTPPQRAYARAIVALTKEMAGPAIDATSAPAPWNWTEHDIKTFAATFTDPEELVRAVLRQCKANAFVPTADGTPLPQVPKKVIAAIMAYGDARADSAPTAPPLTAAIAAMREWAGQVATEGSRGLQA